jgi:hypothetical protein
MPGQAGRAAWLASLAGAALAFTAFRFAAVHGPNSPWVAHVMGFGWVVAVTLMVSRHAPVPRTRPFALAEPLVVIAIAAATLGLLLKFEVRAWTGSLSVLVVLLAAGTSLGAFVGSRIEQPGHLLFVAVASSLADIFSVAAPEGPSAAIVRSEVALSVLALSWPMLGSQQISPLLGVGDVVFTALYVAAARRHDLPVSRTLGALAFAYAMTMLAVLAAAAAVPALPFLGGAMLLAHPRTWRVPERDRRRGLVALSVMTAVFIALVLRR